MLHLIYYILDIYNKNRRFLLIKQIKDLLCHSYMFLYVFKCYCNICNVTFDRGERCTKNKKVNL